ncbi:uncharacterized protein TRIADDRAFT_54433 [Trichoplax adhaerens]|uniref:RAVE complex protein Rav1 C-terminal domain-containing protein n=1 Tax=Trichoplax adhaerens TaxID=10228 RepID=B3RS08_TRIAD|nr:hypothetical protein TRIADDRAFT_54433 [Trichoplax adhaerens]EDV26441.1 hypothetical protein TRIADDRAFT_54433 [Trichoplax adhaerens]|eukprot:XP_002110437.1 hypothetical protein TRIADDRAFT_54433 [Trichoplax adhaerens]
MREHQVLTGTANLGDSTVSVGYVDGIAIVAYASGCDVVILSGQFQRIQTIADLHPSIALISCLRCAEVGGKIAVGIENCVYIIEPKLVSSKDIARDTASYFWEKAAVITTESNVTNLRWTRDGMSFINNLTGYNRSQKTIAPIRLVEFSPDDELFATAGEDDCMVKIWYSSKDSNGSSDETHASSADTRYSFIYITHPRAVTGFSWRSTSKHMLKKTVANVLLTCCMDDICRIWKETLPYYHPLEHQSQEISDKNPSIHIGNSQRPGNTSDGEIRKNDVASPVLHFHIAASIHPSNDMPLLPAITPKSGSNSNKAPFILHWLNNKELQYSISFEAITTTIAESSSTDSGIESAAKGKKGATSKDRLSIPSGTQGENEEFSDYEGAQDDDTPEDTATDKLQPSNDISLNTDKSNKKWKRIKKRGGKKALEYFKVHKRQSRDITSLFGSGRTSSVSIPTSNVSALNSNQMKINELNRQWNQSTDSLFCIHPKDGSLLVWLIEWLDDIAPSCYRQPHVSFSSRIPNAVPTGDSCTLSQKLCIYRTNKQSTVRDSRIKPNLRRARSLSTQRLNLLSRTASVQRVDALSALYSLRSDSTVDIVMITTHSDGTMNKWHVGFADNSYYNTITSLTHGARCCGSRFHTDSVYCHPVLPLLLTVSHQKDNARKNSNSNNIITDTSLKSSDEEKYTKSSELMLWRVDCVGPMFQSGGLYELARIQSSRCSDFVAVAWLPSLLFNSPLSTSSMSLSIVSATPCACFVACDRRSIKFYQAILDAQAMLTAAHDVHNQIRDGYMTTKKETFATLPGYVDPHFIDSIVSLQSGKQPGCILELCTLNDSNCKLSDPIFLHVFSESSLFGPRVTQHGNDIGQRANEHYFVVGLENIKTNDNKIKTMLYMWRILIITEVEPLKNKQNNAEKSDQNVFKFTESAIESLELSTESTVFDNTPKTPMFLSSMHTSASIQSLKVYEKELDLPPDVYVTEASASSDTFITSAIQISSKPNYLILTTCSDSVTRFWNCASVLENPQDITPSAYEPFLWYMWSASRLHDPASTASNKRLVNCSANGKVACLEEMMSDSNKSDWDVKVSIWECESTGSSVWILDDSLYLSDYGLQSMPLIANSDNDLSSQDENVNLNLCWSPCEDGKFLLTVAVASKVFIFAESLIPPYSIGELSSKSTASSLNTPKASPSAVSPVVPASWQKTSTTATQIKPVKHRWSIIREVNIDAYTLYKCPLSIDLLTWWNERNPSYEKVSVPGENVAFATNDEDSTGLFEKAWFTMPILPQYHPHQLIELIKCGRIRRARAILAHLLKCVAGAEATSVAIGAGDETQRSRQFSTDSNGSHNKSFSFSRSRNVSTSSFKGINPDGDIEEERTLSFLPLPLHLLLQADQENYKKLCKLEGEKGVDSAAGFMDIDDYDMLNYDENPSALSSSPKGDDMVANKELAENQTLTQIRQKSLTYFGVAQAKLLASSLAKMQLPGLTSLDQLYLLTLAEDIGSIKVEIGAFSHQDKDEESTFQTTNRMTAASSFTSSDGGGYANVDRLSSGSGVESVDDCGLRFLLAMRLHIALNRSLPPRYRMSLDKQMSTSNFAWAFHSTSAEDLVALIPAVHRGDPSWEELRMVGAGWWIRSNDLLRRCVEKVARTQFNANQNPLDCALLYLAMKKKSLITNLFKTVQDSKMTQFFAHNFAEDRWRKAALKNAYVLLGQQRFVVAAAFFLLGGSLWDAVEVCLNRLNDYQLALVITRLHSGDDCNSNQTLYRILNEYVLGNADDNEGLRDPFLRSITHWWLKDYAMSLNILLDTVSSNEIDSATGYEIVNPDIFYLYYYLRLHPVIKKTRFAAVPASLQQPSSATSAILSRRALSKPNNKPLLSIVTNTNAKSSSVGIGEDGLLYRKERRLFFAAANTHFKTGCPALALEILSLLPDTLKDGRNGRQTIKATSVVLSPAPSSSVPNEIIHTGTFGTFDFNDGSQLPSTSANKTSNATDFDWSQPVSTQLEKKTNNFDYNQTTSDKSNDNAASFDWSQPASDTLQDKGSDFDWSQPVSNKINDTEDTFDWSQPVSNKINDTSDTLDWSQPVSSKLTEDLDMESYTTGPDLKVTNASGVEIDNDTNINKEDQEQIGDTSKKTIEDSMLEHLKFFACLRILLEELRALPADCEITGNTNRLKSRLTEFLKQEFDALAALCDYSGGNKAEFATLEVTDDDKQAEDTNDTVNQNNASNTLSVNISEDTLSHKRAVAIERKKWLLRNQKLLAALLNYCTLHGANSSGLTTIRMGILLLLHESQPLSQQQQQRLSLIPPSEVPPLVTSTLSSSPLFTNPISLIRSLTKDILLPLSQLKMPPSPDRPVGSISVLLSLSSTLSSCIYQCLCCDVFDGEQDRHTFSSQPSSPIFKIASFESNNRLDMIEKYPYSQPSKWPGMQALRSLLSRDGAEESTALRVLLVECSVAVYLTLLASAWSEHLPNQLFRLIGNPLSDKMWLKVFGGSVKLTPKSTQNSKPPGHIDTARRRFNYKVFQSSGDAVDHKNTRSEKYIPPQLHLLEYFLTKPDMTDKEINYDSQESDEESCDELSDVYDDDIDGGSDTEKEVQDQARYDSFSWALMNYAIIKFVYNKFQTLLTVAGIELSELPSSSLLLFNTMKMLERWQRVLLENLEAFNGPPSNFINFVATPIQEDKSRDVAVFKYKGLLEPLNTPFSDNRKAGAEGRLWKCLLKETLSVFVDYVFRQQTGTDSTDQESCNTESTNTTGNNAGSSGQDEEIVLFKSAEAMNSFSLNNGNRNCIVVADKEDLIELDVSPILCPDTSTWIDDNDGLANQGTGSSLSLSGADEFVIIKSNNQSSVNFGSHRQSQAFLPIASDTSESLQCGKATNVLLKRPSQLARRTDSHPQLPFYISGSQDGSVRLWEYGHARCLSTARKSLSHSSPVTGIHFTPQGNKFGVTDGSGTLSLWQLTGNSSNSKPYMMLRCHKAANDFAFVGSSSFIATVGQSLDGRNLCLWDTLVPVRSALVKGFNCHENGAGVVAYAPMRQVIITGGKRGHICILITTVYDVRQRQLRYSFLAHDATINCLTIDETEEFFITGSSDGDIKVWNMSSHDELGKFNGIHTRSGIFKTAGIGVTKLVLLPHGQLFSSGGDGTIKFRTLPETIVPRYDR